MKNPNNPLNLKLSASVPNDFCSLLIWSFAFPPVPTYFYRLFFLLLSQFQGINYLDGLSCLLRASKTELCFKGKNPPSCFHKSSPPERSLLVSFVCPLLQRLFPAARWYRRAAISHTSALLNARRCPLALYPWRYLPLMFQLWREPGGVHYGCLPTRTPVDAINMHVGLHSRYLFQEACASGRKPRPLPSPATPPPKQWLFRKILIKIMLYDCLAQPAPRF